MKFSELVKLLEQNGFRIIKEKGSIRYYGKPDWNNLVRIDYHGAKEVPTGTCHALLKAAGIKYYQDGGKSGHLIRINALPGDLNEEEKGGHFPY